MTNEQRAENCDIQDFITELALYRPQGEIT